MSSGHSSIESLDPHIPMNLVSKERFLCLWIISLLRQETTSNLKHELHVNTNYHHIYIMLYIPLWNLFKTESGKGCIKVSILSHCDCTTAYHYCTTFGVVQGYITVCWWWYSIYHRGIHNWFYHMTMYIKYTYKISLLGDFILVRQLYR